MIYKRNVMYVDCGHGRGIKFIREELDFLKQYSHIRI